MTSSRRRLRIVLVAVAALASALALAPAGVAYERHGFRWEGDPATITYQSLLRTESDKWALDQAVRAWNRQDLRVNFKAVSQGAKVVIRNRTDFSCGAGYARTYTDRGRALNSTVDLGPCSNAERYMKAHTASHELGHVLGLNHEDDVCSQMNNRKAWLFGRIESVYRFRCSPPPAGQWRCRMVESDDARGVQAIYGGSFRVESVSCPIDAADGS